MKEVNSIEQIWCGCHLHGLVISTVGLQLRCGLLNCDDGPGVYSTATIFAYISGNKLAESEKTIVHTQLRDYWRCLV